MKTFEEKVPLEKPYPTPVEERIRLLALCDLEQRKRLLQVHLNQRKRVYQEVREGSCTFNYDKEQALYKLEKKFVIREIVQRVYDVFVRLVEADLDDNAFTEPVGNYNLEHERANMIAHLYSKSADVGADEGLTLAERVTELFTRVWPMDSPAVALRGSSIKLLLDECKISAYVGYTGFYGKSRRKQEYLAFLSYQTVVSSFNMAWWGTIL